MIKQDSFILIWMEKVCIQNKINDGLKYPVNNLNLRIDADEYVCISGMYGADKASFINVISCFDSPGSGKYIFDYNDVAVLSKEKLGEIRKSIGFLFKDLNVIEELTVYQNIELPVLMKEKHIKTKIIAETAQKVGIANLLHTKVNKLSDFEKHKMALARAIVVDPILIIADEPANDLSYEEAGIILDLLNEINMQGTAVLCFSDRTQVIERTKRHIIVESGNIKGDFKSIKDCMEEGAV